MDYINAFVQAEIQEEIYIDLPRIFGGADKLSKVLKLLKNLYRLKQSLKTFFDKLKAGILEHNFIQSKIDKCFVIKGDLICLVCVDDTFLAGANLDNINKAIHWLGMSTKDQIHSSQLRDEGQIGNFLGTRIEKPGDRNFNLTQTGLMN